MAHSPNNEPHLNRSRLLLLVFLVGFLYAAVYCLWYGNTPMGGHPVLDGKENLQLADSISRGSFVAEPFYRAPLYALILSIAPAVGIPDYLWPDYARLLNVIAWLFSLWLVARLSKQLWASDRAAILAAGVWALYPVGIFFLGDPLDITLSIALLLAGLDRGAAFLRSASMQSALACGFLLALAALTRPQMWAVALSAPFVLLAIAFIARAKTPGPAGVNHQLPPRWPVLMCFVGLAIPAVMMGALNKKISGEFAIMPTQGPFNLWAANKPGSHGKYFAQEIEVYQGDRHENPARLESLYHYRVDKGPAAPEDWRSINDYWRDRTNRMIADDPGAFLGRLIRKGYYLLNDYEQYNNKTYGVHKGLSPSIMFNPLGWGLLLSAAVPLLFLGRKNYPLLGFIVMAALAFAAGLVLTYVSARFRLPMAPMLAVIVGGWATLPWQSSGRWQWVGAVTALIVVIAFTFSNGFGVREPKTAVQDYLLLGYAALEANDDVEALDWAQSAMAEDPNRRAAKELAVVAEYNLALETLITTGGRPNGSMLMDRLNAAQDLADYSPRVAYISGVYEYWAGESLLAQRQWLDLLDDSGGIRQDALTALFMTLPRKSELEDINVSEAEILGKAQVALATTSENQRFLPLVIALAYHREQTLNEEGQGILDQLLLVFKASDV